MVCFETCASAAISSMLVPRYPLLRKVVVAAPKIARRLRAERRWSSGSRRRLAGAAMAPVHGTRQSSSDIVLYGLVLIGKTDNERSDEMRRLALVEFLTLDGVMQGFGGPDE